MKLSETNTNTMIKQRKQYIDGLRGLAMLVVVYGHCLLSKSSTEYASFFVFTSAFNVSLFFVISGYLFTTRNDNVILFFKYIFSRLIIPWLILGLFPYYTICNELPLLLSGDEYWFMPALIIGEIVWFFINKYMKRTVIIVLFGLTTSLVGFYLYNLGLFNYAMINRALSIQWLFVIGYILKLHEDIIIIYIRKYLLLLIVAYFLLCLLFLNFYPGEFYDIHLNRYYFIPLTCGLIVLGILVLFTLFKTFSLSPKWLVLIGQNTLPIYIFSDYGRAYFNRILDYCSIHFQLFYPIMAIVETCIACILCLCFSFLANKYLPEIVGRKRV